MVHPQFRSFCNFLQLSCFGLAQFFRIYVLSSSRDCRLFLLFWLFVNILWRGCTFCLYHEFFKSFVKLVTQKIFNQLSNSSQALEFLTNSVNPFRLCKLWQNGQCVSACTVYDELSNPSQAVQTMTNRATLLNLCNLWRIE